MSPNEPSILSASNRRILGWLLASYIRPHARNLFAAAACMVVTAASAAALAWLAGPTLDAVFKPSSPSLLYLIPLGILAISLCNAAALYFQAVLVQNVGQRIVARIQNELFDHLIGADLAYLNRNHSGKLISRCMYDTGQISGLVSGAVLSLSRDVLMFVFLAGVMFYRDWQLSILAFVLLPALAIGVGQIGRRTRANAGKLLRRTARLTTALSEAFDGARLVKVYGTETQETRRIAGAVEDRRKIQYAQTRVRSLSSPLTEVIGGIAIALAIYYGGLRIASGSMTLGEQASFLAALVFCYRPLKRLAGIHTTMQDGLAAAERIYKALQVRAEVVDSPSARPLRIVTGEIRFESVSFRYDEATEVLRKVNLVVPSGRAVAIVGPSGAGKSTLLNLVPRLYDPTEGRVLIDEQDLRDVTLSSLRAQIAVVAQEVFLFDESIRNNIAYGRREATEAEIIAAARAATAHEFITGLPEGYDTVIGERGVRLSGGQRQRIAIARAMLKDAPILLLDEATSSLDNESEKNLKIALSRLMKGRTTVTVAHRLSTVIDADIIYVMRDGEVVETGKHDELLALGGLYAKLYAMQANEDELARAQRGNSDERRSAAL